MGTSVRKRRGKLRGEEGETEKEERDRRETEKVDREERETESSGGPPLRQKEAETQMIIL